MKIERKNKIAYQLQEATRDLDNAFSGWSKDVSNTILELDLCKYYWRLFLAVSVCAAGYIPFYAIYASTYRLTMGYVSNDVLEEILRFLGFVGITYFMIPVLLYLWRYTLAIVGLVFRVFSLFFEAMVKRYSKKLDKKQAEMLDRMRKR